ncbi:MULTISPECIES: hypothetical protein [Vibrio]|uniref:hypothetical protein n=1 Tax=Vibrio TaxID=662 RepID=UPI000C854842|nr:MULTISPECIES: hypothetical protein [Vibrio]MBE8558823.1 hypothetical protein [Vibrio sp. OPT24]PMH49932.1 hypothetical protein BCU65_06350 [Vibrio cyclitrophicus]
MPVMYDGIELPTEEEHYAKLLDGAREKSSRWAENYAEAFLKSVGCPIIHKVDENPKYENIAPGILTPDFIIFSDTLRGNHPDDFYVDVQEVTGGPWDLKGEGNHLIGKPNPMRENTLKVKENNKLVQRYIVNESNPDVLKAIFMPLKKKSKKYGAKKRKSSKFGLISVQGNFQDIAHELHFSKLLWHTMENVIDFMKVSSYSNDEIHKFMDLRLDIMNHKKEGVIPLFLPFDECWCFWALLGSKSYNGLCLLVVNTTALEKLKGLPEYEWLLSFISGENVEFSDKIRNIVLENKN